jgi:hypothetical protein
MERNLEGLVTDVRRRHPDGGPLEQLSDAVFAAQHLNELADELIGHFVDEARRTGASWTEIGQSLGVTKQAAQKRFVPKSEGLARFTDRAQRVIIAAQEEARRAGHDQVGSEHILLGLLGEPNGRAARAIEAQGVSLDAARAALAGTLGPSGGATPDHIPFSARAKKIRELALRESLRLGHPQIGTEHILLAVLRDHRTPGAKALTDLGIRRDQTEQWLSSRP